MTSSYETAPATKLVATDCCACGRPLVDATSVELGIGPVCRSKYGFDLDVSETARKAANAIVYHVAADQAMTSEQALELVSLGFGALAAKLAARLTEAGTVEITVDGNDYMVHAPYSEAATTSWRSLPGRRWDGKAKANRVPQAAKGQLWELLCRHYAGAVLKSAKGTSLIKAA